MRDGTVLVADVHLPSRGGSFPTIIIRTPYSRHWAHYVHQARFLAARGYAVVVQDVRGRYDSDGEWVPFRNEGSDGADTIRWATEQPWSNGRIGTLGGSYAGWAQWAASRERPRGLITMITSASSGRWMEEWPLDNGLVSLSAFAWACTVAGRTMQDVSLIDWRRTFATRPLIDMDLEALGRPLPIWRQWLDHPLLDDYWGAIRLDDAFATIALPVLHITGWFDDDQPGQLHFYEGMANRSPARDRQHLIVGPWDHDGTRTPTRSLAGIDFGEIAEVDIDAIALAWFDAHLAETASFDLPPVTLFETGTNRWVSRSVWPEAGETAWYIDSHGPANSSEGAGTLSLDRPELAGVDSYQADPADPVIVLDEWDLYTRPAPPLPTVNDRIEARRDVLVYTSRPLDQPVAVSGIPRVAFFADSSAPDTDWFVTLTDVNLTEKSMILAKGRLRSRFRHGLNHETFLVRGQVEAFGLDMNAISHQFLVGHRIRLTITSSDFPLYDVNPNTDEAIGRGIRHQIAANRIHHGGTQPSALYLPVVTAHE